MTIHSYPIEEYYLKSSGISASMEFEIAMAAARFGYSPEGFRLLHGDVQSEMVAVYRLDKLVDAVLAAEAEQEAKRKAK